MIQVLSTGSTHSPGVLKGTLMIQVLSKGSTHGQGIKGSFNNLGIIIKGVFMVQALLKGMQIV